MLDEIFEPLDGFDVEVVGRLVEEKHVGIFEEEFCKLDAHAPSARKFGGLPLEVGALKTQAHESLFDVLLEVGHVDGVKFFAQRAYFLGECHVLVRFVVGAGFEFAVDALYFVFGFFQVRECEGGLVEHCPSVLCHEVLRQIRHHAVFGFGDYAASGYALARDNFQESAFARAILAHEGDAVFVVDLERYVLKEGCAPKFYCKIVDAEHCL